jgi:stage III sporulation protein AA
MKYRNIYMSHRDNTPMAHFCSINIRRAMKLQEYLPVNLREQVSDAALQGAEEIRIRVNHPLEILYADGRSQCYGCTAAADLREMLNYLCGYSPYAMEEEIGRGYFTIEGGHRVGVSGRAGLRQSGISDIGAVNIRIAHEKKGCAKEIIPWIRGGGRLKNTFIFSPPGVGKTTLLRDAVRLLSTGDENSPGVKVGVVDERSEIAACRFGIPQNDLGPRTDVLDNCPKPEGMMMLLRSMSPQIIAVDELGGEEDIKAVELCTKSGVAVLGTIHAGTVSEACQKLHCTITQEQIQFVEIIRQNDGTRRIKIYDKNNGSPAYNSGERRSDFLLA